MYNKCSAGFALHNDAAGPDSLGGSSVEWAHAES